MRPWAWTALTFFLAYGCSLQQPPTSSPPLGFYDSEQLWPQRDLRVCWDNPDVSDERQRQWVAKRVQEAWGQAGGLVFSGWGPCAEEPSANIQIHIADQGPYTLGVGKELDQNPQGMLLNFTFMNWSPACLASEGKQRECIESTALHEFGHALGFAHEHNRRDRNYNDCIEPRQGREGDTTVGSYDPQSIMNYCGMSHFANKLSAGDIATVRAMYPEKIPSLQ